MSQPKRKNYENTNHITNARRRPAGLSRARRNQGSSLFDIYRPVGITFGQTARVTAANTGTRAIIIDWTFLDSEGAVLAQFDRQVIEPGKMMSFDLNADDIVRENNVSRSGSSFPVTL